MISAKEALDLYNNSLYTLEKYLNDNFHSGVRQAAVNGNRKYIHNMGSEQFSLPPLSDLEKKAIEELKKLGYFVQYVFYGESYVPRGLVENDGEGPGHKNYGIVVTW